MFLVLLSAWSLRNVSLAHVWESCRGLRLDLVVNSGLTYRFTGFSYNLAASDVLVLSGATLTF